MNQMAIYMINDTDEMILAVSTTRNMEIGLFLRVVDG